MATIKVACPKCGQKVSGDESFFGNVVECPVCSAGIQFPGEKRNLPPGKSPTPVPPREDDSPPPAKTEENLPKATFEEATVSEAPPQASQVPKGKPIEAKSEFQTEEEFDDDIDPEVPSPAAGAISIVTAVLAVVTCFFGLLFAPLAIIFGHISQAKARRSPVQPAPGQTLGAIGMMIGYVWLIIAILLLALAVLFKEPLREPLQQFFSGFNAEG